MYFAIHILPPTQRQRNPENAIRTVPVPIEGDKTFADLLKTAQARFDAASSSHKTVLRFDSLVDKHGAEMFASDKIESLFGSGGTGLELFLYTSEAFNVLPKPATASAGEPVPKRRRLASASPDTAAQEAAKDPIEDFEAYELPVSNAFTLLKGSQRKARTSSSRPWQPEEDRIIMDGIKKKTPDKGVLLKLAGRGRTSSALRSRRRLLLAKLETAPSLSKGGKSSSPEDVLKLQQGRAEGLDPPAMHAQYFPEDRTLKATDDKLRRIDDSNAIPSSSAAPASAQAASSPVEAARARRQSPPQVKVPPRTAYVQLPTRAEVAAHLEPPPAVALPHIRRPTQQEDRAERERRATCMRAAKGNVQEAKRRREDLQTDMDMIKAVASGNPVAVDDVHGRREQYKLQRALEDGRAILRVPESGSLVASTETADEEIPRYGQYEILEKEAVADSNSDEEPGDDNDSSEDGAESMIHDRMIEEVEDEEEHEPVDDLALLEARLVEATPAEVDASSPNTVFKSKQSTGDSAMSVQADERRSKVRYREDYEPIKPDIEQRALRRSRKNHTFRAGAPRSRSRTNSAQRKSDAAPQEPLAVDKAHRTAQTPASTTKPRRVSTRQQGLRSDGPAPAKKSRPSDYDIPTHEEKSPARRTRSAATAALTAEREQLLRKKDWMPPPPKRRDPAEYLPKRKANGDPESFWSDGAESSSSSDSE